MNKTCTLGMPDGREFESLRALQFVDYKQKSCYFMFYETAPRPI